MRRPLGEPAKALDRAGRSAIVRQAGEDDEMAVPFERQPERVRLRVESWLSSAACSTVDRRGAGREAHFS